MRHIVDEVVLDLIIALLTEDDHNGEDKRDNQHNREHHCRNHKADAGEDVRVHVGEVNHHDTHLRRRVITEKRLPISIFLTFFRVVRTTVDLATIGSLSSNLKLIRSFKGLSEAV